MPIAALLPAIIGAGGAIGSSLISRHGRGGGGSTPLLPPGLDQNALLADINQQKSLASTFQTQGASLLGQGQGALNLPLDFYRTILGGDRTAMTQALAPELAAINAQFRAPLTEAGITGRGSALASDLSAGKQSAISNLFFQERPAAADKLTGIAQGLMNLGLSSEQMGAGVLSDATHETLDYNAIIRGIQAQQSAQTAGLFGSLGASLGPILAQVLGGLHGGSSGGPAAPPVPTIDPTVLLPPSGANPELPGAEFTNPALISSLINLGSGGAPNFNASWLTGGSGGG
jgi:hypothetical protein